jgi:hypothetical protein
LYVSKRAAVSAVGYVFATLVGCFVLYMLVVQQRIPAAGAANTTPSGTLAKTVTGKLGLASRGSTVILAMRIGCVYCEKSVPFYRKLVDRYRDSETVHVTAVFPDDAGAVAAYLRIQQLAVHTVTSQPLDSIDVRATPTLLILNPQGRILKAWVGALLPEGEADVNQALAAYR